MKTTKQLIDNLKEGILKDFANELLNNGFRLLILKNRDSRSVTWFHYELNGQIGYCQEGNFGGLTFSTVHKPSREAGTGYGLHDGFNSNYEPTIEDAKQAFILKPNWARNDNFTPIKYKSLEEYRDRETVLKYEILSQKG